MGAQSAVTESEKTTKLNGAESRPRENSSPCIQCSIAGFIFLLSLYFYVRYDGL